MELSTWLLLLLYEVMRVVMGFGLRSVWWFDRTQWRWLWECNGIEPEWRVVVVMVVVEKVVRVVFTSYFPSGCRKD